MPNKPIETEILFPDELLNRDDANALVLVEGQKQLMATRQVTIEGRRSQLTEQVKQYGEKVAALNAEKAAVEENISFLNEQIAAFQHLHDRGLIKDSDLLVLETGALDAFGESRIARVSDR